MKLIGKGAWAVVGLWLLSLFGCATVPVVPVREGEAQAVAIAWRVYGRTDIPPLVRWRSGDQLTCTDPVSGRPGFRTPIGCREGWTFSWRECVASWHADTISFADTVMSHELLHVVHARMGILDPLHRRSDWALVEVANEAIREAGR